MDKQLIIGIVLLFLAVVSTCQYHGQPDTDGWYVDADGYICHESKASDPRLGTALHCEVP